MTEESYSDHRTSRQRMSVAGTARVAGTLAKAASSPILAWLGISTALSAGVWLDGVSLYGGEAVISGPLLSTLLLSLAAVPAVWVGLRSGRRREATVSHPREKAWLLASLATSASFVLISTFVRIDLAESRSFWTPALPGIEDLALVVSLVGLVPMIEELAFRVWLIDRLRSSMAPLVAVAVSAIVYAALHFDASLASCLYLLSFGLTLGSIWLLTRSLVTCVAIHGIFNAIYLFAD